VAALFATIAALRELEPGFVSSPAGGGQHPHADARAGGAHPPGAGDHARRPRDLRRQQPGRAARRLQRFGGQRDRQRARAARRSPAGTGYLRPRARRAGPRSDLVALIRESYDLCNRCGLLPRDHLESVSLDDELRWTREKVDRGASYLITSSSSTIRRTSSSSQPPGRRSDGADHAPGSSRSPAWASSTVSSPSSSPRSPRSSVPAFESRHDDPQAGAGAGRGVVDAAVQRAARRRCAGHPLLHDEPLSGDARHPLGIAGGSPLERGAR